jgi:hypothetical protein
MKIWEVLVRVKPALSHNKGARKKLVFVMDEGVRYGLIKSCHGNVQKHYPYNQTASAPHYRPRGVMKATAERENPIVTFLANR